MTKKPSLRTASYGMCVCVQMPVVCKAMLRLVVVLSAVLRSGSLTRQICFALESEIGRCNLHPGCWFISIRRANQFSFAGGMLRVGVSREGRSCTERKGCFTPEECTIIILYKHARLWREESERERENSVSVHFYISNTNQPRNIKKLENYNISDSINYINQMTRHFTCVGFQPPPFFG